MPRGDGTGPAGLGARTGRAMGFCNPNGAIRQGLGFGLGFRRGFCKSMFINSLIPEDNKKRLEMQKEILEDNLNAINTALGNLNKDK